MSLKFDSSKKLRKEKTKHKVESWEDFEQREQEYLKEKFLSKEPTISASVRITGGKAKNFNIEIPRNTRPLTDRMKVRIFDAIGKDIANKTILDLYAGAGSFALESLSRGAKEATLVDTSKQADLVIRKNIAHTGFLPQAEVIKSKVEDFIAKNKDTDRSWDIIFMDPPYKLYNTKRVFKMQETINSISKFLPGIQNTNKRQFKGALVIKHPKRYPIDTLQFEHIKKVDTYEFGLNSISLYIVK